LPRLHPFAVLPLAMAAPAGAQTIVLPDIVVSANRTPTAAEATGSAVSVLTGETLEADGRPFLQDQLADLPGITVNQSGPPGTISGFALRGAPQQYVRVLVDGIEVSDPAGTQVSPSLSNLLVDDISRVEVLKGSQSALYGGQAVAGVIDLTSRAAAIRARGGATRSPAGTTAASSRSPRRGSRPTASRLPRRRTATTRTTATT
jgi:vitamin B12 transporter